MTRGLEPARPFDRGIIDRITGTLRRPGVGSLLLLIAGICIPLPSASPGAREAHLLGIPTLCPFRFVTGGIPCPGCGMTRSFVCVCHGRVWEAVSVYHPLGPLVVAGFLISAIYGLKMRRKLPDFFVTTTAYLGVISLTIIWLARLLHWIPWPPG